MCSPFCPSPLVKWAIAGMAESIRQEVAPFGIEVVSVGEVRKLFNERNNKQLGDVEKGCKVIFDVMTKKNGKPVPIRLPLGSDGYSVIKGKCDETKELLEEWKDIIDSTDHEEKFY